MLRTLVVVAVSFVVGYVVGVIAGFRAAVVDYVEKDAKKLERLARDIYPSSEEGAENGDKDIPAAVAEAIEEDTATADSDGDSGGSAFY